MDISILNMPNKQSFSTQTHSLEEDIIPGVVERHKDHPSVNLIKSKSSGLASTFFFKPASNAAQEKYIHKKNFKTKFGFFAARLQKDMMLPFLI